MLFISKVHYQTTCITKLVSERQPSLMPEINMVDNDVQHPTDATIIEVQTISCIQVLVSARYPIDQKGPVGGTEVEVCMVLAHLPQSCVCTPDLTISIAKVTYSGEDGADYYIHIWIDLQQQGNQSLDVSN